MTKIESALPLAWRGPDQLARELADTPGGMAVTWLNHWSALSADWPSIARTDVVGIDGTLLQLVLRSAGLRVKRSSADLLIPLYLRYKANASIALIGGADGVARDAAERLENVVLAVNGYEGLDALRAEDYAPLVGHAPEVVILGLGAGLQDVVSQELREVLPDATIFTAGGWLDQLLVSEQYFPPIVHSMRLGWLWRVAHEPRRLLRRYTIDAVAALRHRRRLRSLFAENTLPAGGAAFRGREASGIPVTGSRPNRVLQLVTQLEPAGAQSMAKWTEQALSPDLNVSTYFIYDKAGSDLFPKPNLVVSTRPASIRDAASLIRGLWHLRRENPAVVLAHTHYSILAAAFVWGIDKSVSIIPVHHWPEDRYPWIARLGLKMGRAAGAFADEVFVSKELVTTSRRATVISNPVPAPGTYMDSDELAADIIVVARHAEEKSLDVLLRAMVYMPERHLTLVGGGPLTDMLQGLARELEIDKRVTFAGRLPNPKVRDLMRRCNVFVLPSLWEAMPVALLEAVAENCAIIASDIPAHRFLIENGAAMEFEPGDPVSLSSALLSINDYSYDLREGLRRVRLLYSEQATSKRWLGVIESCVSS